MSCIGQCAVDLGCVEDTSFYFAHFLLLFLIFTASMYCFYILRNQSISQLSYTRGFKKKIKKRNAQRFSISSLSNRKEEKKIH